MAQRTVVSRRREYPQPLLYGGEMVTFGWLWVNVISVAGSNMFWAFHLLTPGETNLRIRDFLTSVNGTMFDCFCFRNPQLLEIGV